MTINLNTPVPMDSPKIDHDVIIIGGGQTGLAAAYYLRRAEVEFTILDDGNEPGGAWLHGWDSLRLFSPASFSSLPGWLMPPSRESDGYPTRDEVISYLQRYEERYKFPVERPHKVESVTRESDVLRVILADGSSRTCHAVISATGTWSKPFVPDYLGKDLFSGVQIHSAHYETADDFAGQRVLIVGGGNSGAQILADLSTVAETIWVTLTPPVFLPDEIDGRVLFENASARVRGDVDANTTIGDIIMVAPVKAARDRGVLNAVRPFKQFTEDGVVWADQTETKIDAVIWCTGFRPATDHLKPLGVVEPNGRVQVIEQRSIKEPGLWLAGYGNWTGAASATLIGAGRTAREFVPRLVADLIGSSE
ncbi:ArsO family NAD(P)H-dependent flavin-containing monooxygenase [Brucella tritici]|nr:ArsO family NAD(P)H-dependent flavin-containing monooxygenase [Brucella tritici]